MEKWDVCFSVQYFLSSLPFGGNIFYLNYLVEETAYHGGRSGKKGGGTDEGTRLH